MELSKIELEQVKEDYESFNIGLKPHIQALSNYITLFQDGHNSPVVVQNMEDQISKLIFDQFFNFRGKGETYPTFISKSIKKLWKKINKK